MTADTTSKNLFAELKPSDTSLSTITMHLLVNQGYPGTRPVTFTPRLTRVGDDDPDSEDTIP